MAPEGAEAPRLGLLLYSVFGVVEAAGAVGVVGVVPCFSSGLRRDLRRGAIPNFRSSSLVKPSLPRIWAATRLRRS